MDGVVETTLVGVRLGSVMVGVGGSVGVEEGRLEVGDGTWVEVNAGRVGRTVVATLEGVGSMVPFRGRLQAHSRVMKRMVEMNFIGFFIPAPPGWGSVN
jgi:hypothetical protein